MTSSVRKSGGGIERVFFSGGKQDDVLEKTMDKTLENTLKTSINTKLPTCDDKGVFTDERRWLSDGLTQWI